MKDGEVCYVWLYLPIFAYFSACLIASNAHDKQRLSECVDYALSNISNLCTEVCEPTMRASCISLSPLPSHSPSHFNWRQHLGLRKWLEIAKRLHFGYIDGYDGGRKEDGYMWVCVCVAAGASCQATVKPKMHCAFWRIYKSPAACLPAIALQLRRPFKLRS